MKKIYSLLICSVVALSAFGQARISGTLNSVSVETPAAIKGSNPSIMVVDTLYPTSWNMPCFTGDTAPFVYYNLGAAGYLAGNSSYGQTEAAQKYTITGSGSVSEVLVWYAWVTGTNGTTSAKVYSLTGGVPATALGTSSNTVTTGSLSTSAYTSYTFSPAVSVTNKFAVASVFPTTTAAGDTVCVVSTKITCFEPDTASFLNIPPFGGWFTTQALLNTPATPEDSSIDLMILPVIDIVIGVNEYPSSNGLSLMGAYPNPASDFTNIKYSTSEAGAVSVEVFDLTGRVIHHSSEKLSAGTHDLKVSLKDVAAGKYYYTIKTGGAQLTSKFVVAK